MALPTFGPVALTLQMLLHPSNAAVEITRHRIRPPEVNFAETANNTIA